MYHLRQGSLEPQLSPVIRHHPMTISRSEPIRDAERDRLQVRLRPLLLHGRYRGSGVIRASGGNGCSSTCSWYRLCAPLSKDAHSLIRNPRMEALFTSLQLLKSPYKYFVAAYVIRAASVLTRLSCCSRHQPCSTAPLSPPPPASPSRGQARLPEVINIGELFTTSI